MGIPTKLSGIRLASFARVVCHLPGRETISLFERRGKMCGRAKAGVLCRLNHVVFAGAEQVICIDQARFHDEIANGFAHGFFKTLANVIGREVQLFGNGTYG